MSHLPVAVGETLAGKYRIERIIGEGGMGVVVAAHHLELDQPVAIKFLLESVADEEGAERFRREARAAAKIHSDHVVRVLDVGVLDDEGVRYMVMEYLEGRDLAEELVQRGSLPIGVACGIILEALDAIGQAHTVGIVHRDLKPANLFLANRPDGSTRVKVLDFGISKSVGQSTVEQLSLTKTSAWIGSPLYMAPEQMQSARDVDARADIWSLGAILYEMISGSPPYEADSLPQLCNLLITKDAPHLAERCPAIPSDLADLIMGCLVRDREQRIARTVDLAATLGRYATTSTGSGMSRTLLERTELQGVQSMPGSAMMHSQGPLSGGHAAQDRGSLPGLPVEGGKTHAAWGGTDPGQSGSTQGRLKVVALALAALVSVGAAVVAFGGGSASPESAPEELVVEQQGASLKVEKEAAGVAEAKEEDLPEPEPSQPDPPPTEDAAGPATRPKAVQRAQPAPPPAVRPRPTVQQPAPKPTPEPAPAKTGGEDIEDLFGGRR